MIPMQWTHPTHTILVSKFTFEPVEEKHRQFIFFVINNFIMFSAIPVSTASMCTLQIKTPADVNNEPQDELMSDDEQVNLNLQKNIF